jgi:hypothetical protein
LSHAISVPIIVKNRQRRSFSASGADQEHCLKNLSFEPFLGWGQRVKTQNLQTKAKKPERQRVIEVSASPESSPRNGRSLPPWPEYSNKRTPRPVALAAERRHRRRSNPKINLTRSLFIAESDSGVPNAESMSVRHLC